MGKETNASSQTVTRPQVNQRDKIFANISVVSTHFVLAVASHSHRFLHLLRVLPPNKVAQNIWQNSLQKLCLIIVCSLFDWTGRILSLSQISAITLVF